MKDNSNNLRLIIAADDFGMSLAVNEAVKKAYSSGILTCASLMIGGQAAENAVRIAQDLPELETGLHVTLTELHPLMAGNKVPLLLTKDGEFRKSPACTGLLLQFKKEMLKQADMEISAQFKAYEDTGLDFTHADTHHHLHLHPKVLNMMLKYAVRHKVKSIRVPDEPWHVSKKICKDHYLINLFYRIIFSLLCRSIKIKLVQNNIKFCDGVFGLYKTGEITEQWLIELFDKLKGSKGTYELYTHPTCDRNTPGFREYQALVSSFVRNKIEETGITLISHKNI